MFLLLLKVLVVLVGLPHARGGVSAKAVWVSCSSRSSPRPWGCFPEPLPLRDSCKVFPTPVGVFLNLRKGVENAKGLPHARGGVSGCAGDESDQHLSSPRPWGCFPSPIPTERNASVFPTPVGVFLTLTCWLPLWASLPHARGGVSYSRAMRFSPPRSSPRPWGCFQHGNSQNSDRGVFPTPVGVFPLVAS